MTAILDPTYHFECEHCGCEFTAVKDECSIEADYDWDKNSRPIKRRSFSKSTYGVLRLGYIISHTCPSGCGLVSDRYQDSYSLRQK